MPEPYTIHVFVVEGDPDGVKIVDRQNWTGWGIALPRSAWPRISKRQEFGSAGVYVLTGPTEGASDDEPGGALPTVYVGQGDEIRSRMESHFHDKDFWDWAYVFISKGSALNRAHTTWLEYALIHSAHEAKQCHVDNSNYPKEPRLSEWERADTLGFLNGMLRILPLLGVRVFDKPVVVDQKTVDPPKGDGRDTVVVPAKEEGFQRVFIGQQCWQAIRISGGMLPRIKYIAAYRSAPISAITHYAPVERVESYGDTGKYRLVFAQPASEIPPIPFGDAAQGSMQGPRYTSLQKLLASKSVAELLGGVSGSIAGPKHATKA